jgi:hypothetical protein
VLMPAALASSLVPQGKSMLLLLPSCINSKFNTGHSAHLASVLIRG